MSSGRILIAENYHRREGQYLQLAGTHADVLFCPWNPVATCKPHPASDITKSPWLMMEACRRRAWHGGRLAAVVIRKYCSGGSRDVDPFGTWSALKGLRAATSESVFCRIGTEWKTVMDRFMSPSSADPYRSSYSNALNWSHVITFSFLSRDVQQNLRE